MRFHSSVVVVVWLVALCCDVTGFSIRRSSTPKSDLSEAFRVLERHRRRIRDDEFLTASRMPDPNSPILPSEIAEWDRSMPSREEQAWIQDAFGISPYDNNRYESLGFQDETKDNPGTTTVQASNEEIQDIFGDEKGDNSQASTNAGDSSQVDSGDENIPEAESDVDNLTEDEFKALMRAVEKLQKRALVKKDTKNTISKLTTPQPVSKEEISAVFEETDDDNGHQTSDESESKPEDASVETTGEVNEPALGVEELQDEDGNSLVENEGIKDKYKETLSNIENYWRLNDYFNNEEKRRKRFTKRAPVVTPPDSVPLEETYMKEIENLKTQIDKLKLISQLEDMENDALTQTLNEATLTQLEGTVSPKEFGSLEQAIKLEEALQDLKNGKVNPFVVELVAANAIRGFSKRGEPLWRKNRKRMDQGGLEESYPMYSTNKRQIKRDQVEGGYLLDPSEKRSSKREQEEDVDRWYDTPAREDRSEESQRYIDAQNAIDAMVEQLAAEELKEEEEETSDTGDNDEDDDMLIPPPTNQDNSDTDVIPYSLDKESDQGRCPSLSLLTDCQFADLQGLPIDAEARDLCNRHQLCYECGATTGTKMGECDNMYRGDAAILCDKDTNCVNEAELFLQQMKLKHRFSRYYRGVCANSCTESYIGI